MTLVFIAGVACYTRGMKQQFTQKYCLVRLLTPLPDGFEFVMQDWPLHVTLADVFKIDSAPGPVLDRLVEALSHMVPFSSTVTGDEWFGHDRSVHVRLLDRTPELQMLHETCIAVLSEFGVEFNSPQFMRAGFRPHSTVRHDSALALGDAVAFDALTLIDMFPGGDPAKRRIVGTVPIGKSTLRA